jgi:hypothetical protein
VVSSKVRYIGLFTDLNTAMKTLLVLLLLILSTTAQAEKWVDLSNTSPGTDLELLDIDYTADPANRQLRTFRYILGNTGEVTYSQITVQIDCTNKLMRRLNSKLRLRRTQQTISSEETGLWLRIDPSLIGHYPPYDLICR